MKIAGFLKARNEVLKGNIYRALANLEAVCDCGVLCDDASVDGTGEILEAFVQSHAHWILYKVEPHEQAFEKEMTVKQAMLQLVHSDLKPDWVWWLDADETLDAEGTAKMRQWLESPGLAMVTLGAPAFRFHYTQLWRNTSWARTDQGFDDGVFVKLWKYHSELSFDTRPGTHHAQFPQQLIPIAQQLPVAPFEVIHWGNVGVNLRFKALQYSGGRGGVDRHLAFGHMPEESLATGIGFDKASWSAPNPTYREVPSKLLPSKTERLPGPTPQPFSFEHIKQIRAMGGLRSLAETFAVIVPAFNRARALPKALDSLLAQTYPKWVAIVLDDGSTDDTAQVMQRYQELDPRIFYARYQSNRGGVAMNEIGMNIACEVAEWWSRLGSDDWFGPNKLALDAKALQEYKACYGLYTVVRGGQFAEICNPPLAPQTIREMLLGGRYVVSWANIAARTSALRKVKERFGEFTHKDLRNCEDFLLNARLVACGVDFHWRGPEGVDPTPLPGTNAWDSRFASTELEAIWTAAETGGASSPENAPVLAHDEVLTRQLIAQLSVPQ